MKILVLNSGSSSYKLALYAIDQSELGCPQAPIWKISYDKQSSLALDSKDELKEKLKSMPTALSEVDVVGHRIVHGGSYFQGPAVVTQEVKQAISQLIPLAPLHHPQNLQGIEIMQSLLPHTPQVAVFDTAFHSSLSLAASTYPGPYAWKDMGIKRFGFHGISYEYCAARCASLLQQQNLKLVCCHLGNGASIAAIDSQRSVDTTMGFTPLEGVMMGSRCGSIDPGILLFLQQHKKRFAGDLFEELNCNSGLKGISGVSGDMRTIIKLSVQGDERASLAFAMYIHSLKRHIGAMIAVLNGFDVLIFTGGIGENAALVRHATCQGLQHLGISLDEEKNNNSRADAIISSKGSLVKVALIATQEDWCIACTIEKMRRNGTV